jgi:hypothetical protein
MQRIENTSWALPVAFLTMGEGQPHMDRKGRMISLLPALWICWAGITVVLAGLLIYRSLVARKGRISCFWTLRNGNSKGSGEPF